MASQTRSRKIFEYFKKSLFNTSMMLADTVTMIDDKIDLYSPTSKGVPLVLHTIRKYIKLILNHVNLSISNIERIEDDKTYYYVDVRGTWRIMLEIIERVCAELKVTLMKLPGVNAPESIYKKVVRRTTQLSVLPILRSLTEDCETLTKIFDLFMKTTFESDRIDNEQSIKIISSIYVYPFWYRFNRYLARFRDMFEILKSSIVHSYGHSNFLTRKFALSLRSFEAMITDSKTFARKTSQDCERLAASSDFVKRMWNLAESGLPQLFLSFMKPWIKTSVYFCLPIPDNMKSHLIFRKLTDIRILIVSSKQLPFKIPNEWIMSAEKMTPDELIKNKDILESTRLQASKVNIFDHLESEVDRLNGQVDNQLMGSKFEGENVLSNDTNASNDSATIASDDMKERGGTNEGASNINDELDVILHFHGGGFISGSPGTHECYLREWASMTNYVIFSVDYSLAPESAYPKQFHQCYFAYHWLVSSNSFGIKIRKIILVGDSAGGTLVLSVTYKAIEDGLRVPDGLLLAYPATDLTRTLTPSRLLFANDVLLPHYFLQVCLDSYVKAGVNATNHLVSPLYAPPELLQKLPENIVIMAAGFDPLLDDTLRFLHKLDQQNKNYIFELYNCPHGFLNMGPLMPAAKYAIKRAGQFLKSISDENYAKTFYSNELNKKYLHNRRLGGMHLRLTLPLDLLNPENKDIDKRVSAILSNKSKPIDYSGEIEDMKLILKSVFDNEIQYNAVSKYLDSICQNKKTLQSLHDQQERNRDESESAKIQLLLDDNRTLFRKIASSLTPLCKNNQQQLDFLQAKLQTLESEFGNVA